MCKKIIIILLPVFLFACTALKPVEKLTDGELADRYDKIDLQIYMVKRSGKSNPTSKSPDGYGDTGNSYSGGSGGDIEKIKKLEEKLGVVRQELIRRGYIP